MSSVSLQGISNASECQPHTATREQQGATGESQRGGEAVTAQKEIYKPVLDNAKYNEESKEHHYFH